MHRRRVLGDRIRYVGLDVHKDRIAVAVAQGSGRGEGGETGRIPYTPAAWRRLARKLGREEVRLRLLRDRQDEKPPTLEERILAWRALNGAEQAVHHIVLED